MANDIEDIRNKVKDKKAIVGTKLVIKNIRLGKVSKVFVTFNCPEDVKETIKKYADMNQVEVVQLSQPNTELGVVCKKPFSVSVLGFKKGV